MRRRVHSGLCAVLTLAGGARAGAGEPHRVCSLLTAAEVETAIGAKVGPSHGLDIPIASGAMKGETLTLCTWTAGSGKAALSLSMVPLRSASQREAGLARLEEGRRRLQAQGWTSQDRTIGGTRCGILTPPATLQKTGPTTGCLVEAKGMGISIATLGPGLDAPPDKLKELLDTAVGRLR